MSRDPVVVLRECADLVPGTTAEAVLRADAASLSRGTQALRTVRWWLRVRVAQRGLYTADECAAMTLAAEELAR